MSYTLVLEWMPGDLYMSAVTARCTAPTSSYSVVWLPPNKVYQITLYCGSTSLVSFLVGAFRGKAWSYMSLSQKDLTYIATPDLRTRYHPGQTLNCVLKEYDRREGQFWVSVKDTVDNPFFGALRRHPIGSRRQAVISGKYGGGVFCTLSDETVCLCHYSTLHSDLDFHVGDTVILAIKQFDYERSLIYGRILSKW